MPLILENFTPGIPQNSLRQHHSRDAYQKLSKLITKAHSGLIRIRHDGNEHTRFETWFGSYTDANKLSVFRNIKAIHNAIVTQNIIFQHGGQYCQIGDFAYVIRNNGTMRVHLCDHFFHSGRSGVDSTVGTIIHEISHLVANTNDHGYGQHTCQLLAQQNPNTAIRNADNYQYYCESFT